MPLRTEPIQPARYAANATNGRPLDPIHWWNGDETASLRARDWVAVDEKTEVLERAELHSPESDGDQGPDCLAKNSHPCAVMLIRQNLKQSLVIGRRIFEQAAIYKLMENLKRR